MYVYLQIFLSILNSQTAKRLILTIDFFFLNIVFECIGSRHALTVT